MLNYTRKSTPIRSRRGGFTLVEMMVAVALVLLMMTMFAEIFSIATGSMNKQKGLAELDQRQRVVTTIIRDDLQDRTFTNVYPFHPADDSNRPTSSATPSFVSFSNGRTGYFYISENDPERDDDDTLQFTVTRLSSNPFFGRAWPLVDKAGNGVLSNLNQPEYDDSSAGDFVGSSTSAEISYFLRNGILYRRVLLIRQPLFPRSTTGVTDDAPSTPPSAGPPPVGPQNLIQPGIYPQGSGMGGTVYTAPVPASMMPYTNRFLNDFDYSATYSGGRVTFLSQANLDNSGIGSLALGLPQNRFGFSPGGAPLEYVGSPPSFIGRFTHEETSHPAFGWPGDPGPGPDGTLGTGDDINPYTRTYTPATGLTINRNNAVVAAFAGGTRQGEDILLTGVLGFDVKVWDYDVSLGPDQQPGFANFDDDGANGIDDAGERGWPGSDDGAFVDLGHSGGRGDYRQAQKNLNSNYGPLGGGNRVFDTWHPSAGAVGPPLSGLPPFRPARMGRDGAPGFRLVDDDQDGNVDNDDRELGWPGSDDIPVPMKAIQIRIRYRDVSTGLVRDMTIVKALLNPEAKK